MRRREDERVRVHPVRSARHLPGVVFAQLPSERREQLDGRRARRRLDWDSLAQLIVRFGGIADRKADPLSIVKSSVKESGWRIATVKPAGSAASGKRQSLHFARTSSAAKDEYDVWARRT